MTKNKNIICLYGHIRKKNFYLHLKRIFPNFQYYLHSWDELHPHEKTWHSKDNQNKKYLSSKILKNIISTFGKKNFLIDSQNDNKIKNIASSRRKYYSLYNVLFLVQEDNPFVIISRPDIIHHKKINLKNFNLKKNQIICSFDLSKTKISKYPKEIGSTDLLLAGYKKDLIKLSSCLLQTKVSQDKYNDLEFMIKAIEKEDLEILQLGYINEREFHIWRFKNRFRFKSICSDIKDYFYSLKETLKI